MQNDAGLCILKMKLFCNPIKETGYCLNGFNKRSKDIKQTLKIISSGSREYVCF
jgi:hypothetical protein